MARTVHSRGIRKFDIIVIIIAMIVFAVVAVGDTARKPISSSETQFVERSARGLQIVPASCPSSPHDGGSCTGRYRCQLDFNPSPVAQGSYATLSWAGTFEGQLQWPGGSMYVDRVGSMSVYADQTKTYRFGYIDYNLGGWETIWCSATLTVCPAGQAPVNGVCGGAQCTPQYYCSGNDLYQRSAQCTNTFVQACAWGCAGSACVLPPPPSGNITATPVVVRSGNKSEISWTAENVQSCTVTENNADINDSWTGITGTRMSSNLTQQTVYTLRCIDLEDEEFLDSVTVNIIPVWEEQ